MASPSGQDVDTDDTSVSGNRAHGLPRSSKTTCHRSCLLSLIAIAVAVAALVGAGGCFAVYITARLGHRDGNQSMTTTHTVPYLTTTLPEVTTTLMEATTTLDVTTIVPQVTTTLPEVTTTLPDSPKIPLDVTTSTSTESTATLPQMSTTKGVVKGDVCRVGYKLLVGTCIRLACDEKSHGDALLACQEDGATLAMPKTEELDIALRNLVKTEGGNKDHWIGITKFTRATWKWADGTLLGPEYEGWNPNEPNIAGYEVHEICVQYWQKWSEDPMWDDTDCPVHKRFICQAPTA